MKNPKTYYTERTTLFSQELKAVKKQLGILSVFRLLVFLSVCLGVYWFWGNLSVLVPLIIIGIALFIYLISKYTDVKYKKNKILQLIDLNQTELKVLKRDFHTLDDGKEFTSYAHDFSHDIDLFGKGGFFQYCNRTATRAGKELLARLLTENTTENIPEKQKTVQELTSLADWRQDFSATASLVKVGTSIREVSAWLWHYKPFIGKKISWLPYVFSACSILIFTTVLLDLIPSSIIVYWFFIGLGISGRYVKKVNVLAENTSKVQDTFQQYYQLIEKIEKAEFHTELLKEKQKTILRNGSPTSKILKGFSKALDTLEQRNNLLFSIPANAFLLIDMINVRRIEKWIEIHQNEVEKWFAVIAFFDAYNSLGNFAFNHPSYAFPEIKKSSTVIQATQLGHPLIDEEKLIHNDFHIEKESFYVITGANMAGKSTFLRTVSLHIMMANCGLPVCASESKYTPIKLITSMRTADSLIDDASYFYSELKRLKLIVEKIKTDTYFVVLDEILKGTNSKDKAIGSRKFIEKLSASKSTGIIATHDLSLCEVTKENDKVENYFFEAFINEKELSFDYKFKEGVCQNMNASFLLKNMGIV